MVTYVFNNYYIEFFSALALFIQSQIDEFYGK